MATKAKADRTLAVLWGHKFGDGSESVAVRVRVGKDTDLYTVSRDLDSCEVVWSHNTQPERSYTVTCTVAGVPFACTCPGKTYRGGECRHMAGTVVLIESGRLDNGPTADDYPEGWGWSDERAEGEADYWRAVCGDSVRVGCR